VISVLEIDGSHGSGGGQVLRTSIGLACLLERPVRVFNIRAGRPRPGLRPQHLEGLKAVADFCSGELKGAELGSREVEFRPGSRYKEELEVRIPTAGSIGLVLQALLTAAVGRGVFVRIEGGATFGKWAPPITYVEKVLAPALEGMGYKVVIRVEKQGFYPAGGARVEIRAEPAELRPLNLTGQGEVRGIHGFSIASRYLGKARVAERQAEAAGNMLRKYQVFVKKEYAGSECPGSAVVLYCTSPGRMLGSSSLGERGKPAEDVGRDAARGMLDAIRSRAGVDEHLSDQVLPFMALAKGRSEILAPKLTRHAETSIWVIGRFLDAEFSVKKEGKLVRISCQGKGYNTNR
jgi:RNA 3'-phosphate cyclase